MQRIRSIDKAYDEIKAKDPETAISRYLVRAMVNQGIVPSIKNGKRKLVDVDVLEECIKEMTARKEGVACGG